MRAIAPARKNEAANHYFSRQPCTPVKMSASRGMTWTATATSPNGDFTILGVCKDIYDLVYSVTDDDYYPEHSTSWKIFWDSMSDGEAEKKKRSVRKSRGGEIFRVTKDGRETIYSISLAPNYHRW